MYKSDRKWRLQYVKEQIQECLEGFKFMTNNEENRNTLKEEVEDIIDEELCSMTMGAHHPSLLHLHHLHQLQE